MPSTFDSIASGMESTELSMHETPVLSTPSSQPSGVADGGKDKLKEKEKEKESWWQWLTHKADGVKEWVDGFVHDHVPGKNKEDDNGKGR
jgi:hypothetical protein